jgi:2-methylcitrate dehydratase PrpD
VQAAALAAAGLGAATEVLDGPHGLGRLMVGPDLDELRARTDLSGEHGQTLRFDAENVGEPPALETYGLKVKRFPNCGSVHRALDGLLELREAHGLSPHNVARIDVFAPRAHLANLPFSRPTNAREARFSLEYCLAIGLLSGANTLNDFTDEAVARSGLEAMMARIHRHALEGLESANPTRVTVTMNGGQQMSTVVYMPAGSKANPLTTEQLRDKFLDCAGRAIEKDRAGALYERLVRIENVTQLSALLKDLRRGARPHRLRTAG